MNKKNTTFCEMVCCKCKKPLGMITSNHLIQSNSFIPPIDSIKKDEINFNLYCNECFIKEVSILRLKYNGCNEFSKNI